MPNQMTPAQTPVTVTLASTPTQFVDPEFPRPTPGLAELLQQKDRDHKELIRLATPIFKAMHSKSSYFQSKDNYFWSQYINSGIVGAQRLVAKHCGVFIPLQCHETPNDEVQKTLDDWEAENS